MAVGGLLQQKLLLLLFDVTGIVAGVVVELTEFEFVDLADYPVNEHPVVGDQDDGLGVFLQVAFQPLDRLHVQMVGRLVQQQDVRLDQQQLDEADLGLLAAGERRDRPVQIIQGKAEAGKQGELLLVVVIAVLHLKVLLKSRIAVQQFLVVFAFQPQGDLIHFLFDVEQTAVHLVKGFPDRHVLVFEGLLGQIAQRQAAVADDLTPVRFVFPGDQP